MTERIFEFIKSLFETGKERINNPIVGTFLIAFVAFNWKKIFIIFGSKNTIETRISYIDNNYETSWNNYLFWMPLVVTIFYVFVLPFIMRLIELKLKNVTSERKNYKAEEIKADLERRIEIIKKKNDLEDVIAKLATKEELNKKIKELSENSIKQQGIITGLKQEVSDTEQERTDFEELSNEKDIQLKSYENEFESQKTHITVLEEQINNKDLLIFYSLDADKSELKKWDESYRNFRKSPLFNNFRDLKILFGGHHSLNNYSKEFIKDALQNEVIAIHSLPLSEDQIKHYNKKFHVDSYILTPKGRYFWYKYKESLEVEVIPFKDLN